MGERYAFDELTKQMVSQQCHGADAPNRAADIAAATILAGIRGTRSVAEPQTPAESVRLVTKGMVNGLIVVEGDVASAGIALLKALAELAQQTNIDPTEMLTWCLEGLAEQSPLVPPAKISALSAAIDREFMGAGMLFNELCRKARNPS